MAQRNTGIKRNRRKAEAATRRMTRVGTAINDLRNSARWQHLRAIVRHRQPLCRDPFGTHRDTGIVTPSQQVHHIIAAQEDPDKFFDITNLAGICTRCHGRIEAMERKGEDTVEMFSKYHGKLPQERRGR